MSEPSIINSPISIPNGTEEAKTITEMYSWKISPGNLLFVYDVGVSPTDVLRQVIFRNNCQNTDLEVVLSVPTFLNFSASEEFIVSRNTTVSWNFNFNENRIKQYSAQTSQPLNELLQLHVSPINVNGPVYVFVDLPSL